MLILDIETNSKMDHIWFCGTKDTETGVKLYHTSTDTLQPLLDSASIVVGWNIISFDWVKLTDYWGIHLPLDKIRDGIIMSKAYDTKRTTGHNLASYGIQFNFPKGDFTDYDNGDCQENRDYCGRDLDLTEKAYDWLAINMEESGFDSDFLPMEYKVRNILDIQERNGFRLDLPKATALYIRLAAERSEIERKLHQVFPPIVTERWSDKTNKRLKDNVEVFNVGSRQQIARRLKTLGCNFSKRTGKTDKGGGGNLIIDEGTLKPFAKTVPEAAMALSYLTIGKKASMVAGWLRYVDDDGRVHGRVDTLGAVTSRMTHSSPNVAQVDSAEDMRECWIVDEGYTLVGVDAEGLELRCLAHYMQDEEYTSLILSGDVHWFNALAAGIAKEGTLYDEGDPDLKKQRNDAKTFIYAFLYGSGDKALGAQLGKTANDGKKMKSELLESLPKLADLREKILRISRGGSLPAIDGRRLRVYKSHAALNVLLQGLGSIIMKRALCIAVDEMDRLNLDYRTVANVHDEIQSEVKNSQAKQAGEICCEAIVKAGEYYNLRIPMAGKAQLGINWSQTH